MTEYVQAQAQFAATEPTAAAARAQLFVRDAPPQGQQLQRGCDLLSTLQSRPLSVVVHEARIAMGQFAERVGLVASQDPRCGEEIRNNALVGEGPQRRLAACGDTEADW